MERPRSPILGGDGHMLYSSHTSKHESPNLGVSVNGTPGKGDSGCKTQMASTAKESEYFPLCVARAPAARSTSGRTRRPKARRYLSLSGPTGCTNLLLVSRTWIRFSTSELRRSGPGPRISLMPIPNAELVIIIFLRACGK